MLISVKDVYDQVLSYGAHSFQHHLYHPIITAGKSETSEPLIYCVSRPGWYNHYASVCLQPLSLSSSVCVSMAICLNPFLFMRLRLCRLFFYLAYLHLSCIPYPHFLCINLSITVHKCVCLSVSVSLDVSACVCMHAYVRMFACIRVWVLCFVAFHGLNMS